MCTPPPGSKASPGSMAAIADGLYYQQNGRLIQDGNNPPASRSGPAPPPPPAPGAPPADANLYIQQPRRSFVIPQTPGGAGRAPTSALGGAGVGAGLSIPIA